VGSLFLVRHATTEASSSGRNLGRRADPPLTDDGRELAVRSGVAIAAELAALPHDRLRVVSSPARRCRETAAPIATAIGVAAGDVEIDSALLEIDYGAWDGLTADECLERDPQLRAAWEEDPYHTTAPGGESGADVAARAFPALAELEAWLAADRARAAVAVSHNHVVRLHLTAVLGLALPDYRRRVVADPGGYSVITVAPGARVVRRVNVLPA
jgi:probable phosphoglycerate mutase